MLVGGVGYGRSTRAAARRIVVTDSAFSMNGDVHELVWPAGVEIGVVETVGGVHSPLADDADSATFAEALGGDHVVLVADAGLGAINAVRLCVDALTSTSITVMLNRFDGDTFLHCANRDWLIDRDGLTVVTTVSDCVASVLRHASIGLSDPGGRLT